MLLTSYFRGMRAILFLVILFLSNTVVGQSFQGTSRYYFGDTISFNRDIPYPLAQYGQEVGEFHVRHDQLYGYMRQLAEMSDRAIWQDHGQSYEKRRLGVLIVTSPENHAKLETIRKAHLDDLKNGTKTEGLPAIIYQGYSIHGDESSGANAALLYAYYLTAAKGPQIEERLKNCIILLDPCFNPDGLDRFAHWANTNRGKHPVGDPQSREHSQHWPRGRTNHYWFDLNRDWLPVQHPESQGRITMFHRWKPQILTDHHEMGTNSTYFFQPGVPSRTNPLTPKKNQELTGDIAAFHAKRLDEAGSFYYTRESFDDFYYGKGSTYPDVNGCIGILFEQASSRGHTQESVNGLLTFEFTIRNQLMTSFSTLEAGYSLRKDLRDYQVNFYQASRNSAAKDKNKALIFGDSHDRQRADYLAQLIQRHGIAVHRPSSRITAKGKTFDPENSYVVPLAQEQYRLILAMWQQRTQFDDSLFYDISAWTMPLAFGLDHAWLGSGEYNPSKLGGLYDGNRPVVNFEKSEYAYLIPWDDYHTPSFLYAMLAANIPVKVAHQPFTAETSNGQMQFKRGTLMVPVQTYYGNASSLFGRMKNLNNKQGVRIYSAKSGLTPEGVDLGSPSFGTLRKPKILVVVGDGVSSYDAGEVWHLLDNRMDIPVTTMETGQVSRNDLDRYNVIILSDGSYSGLKSGGSEKLKKWVKRGGTLLAVRGGIRWAKGEGLTNISFKDKPGLKDYADIQAYSDLKYASGAQVIGGAIVEAKADLTHPLLYGYHNKTMPLFYRGTQFVKPISNSWAAPLQYTSKPLLSGYISDENEFLLKGSPALWVSRAGSGRVICFSFNPNFRAFWYGTNKLFMNAIFFGKEIRRDAMSE